MNFQEIVTLLQLQGGARLLAVKFVNEKDMAQARVYNYKCLLPEVALGDLVVVETYAHFSVAKVVAELPAAAMAGVEYDQLRHVVARLDLTAYDKVMAAERQVKDRMAMAEINERLESVRRNYGALDDFRALLASHTTEQVIE